MDRRAPAVALEASQRVLEHTTVQMLQAYRELLAGSAALEPGRLQALGRSLETTYAFVSRIEMLPSDRAATAQRIAQLHAIDHLLRLRVRLDDLLRAGIDLTSPRYAWALSHNQTILELAERGLREHRLTDMLPELQVNAVGLTELSRQMRHELLDGSDDHDSSDAANVLLKADAYRWLERTGHHLWRISHYLAVGRPPTGQVAGQAVVPAT